MQVPYAKVGEDGVHYNGPALADRPAGDRRIGIFGPDAERVVTRISPMLAPYHGRYTLIAVNSDVPWGKASNGLVKLIYDQEVLGLIATDRNSSHLAEQLAAKSFVPLIAVSADHTLSSVNIPWVLRLPAETSLEDALSRFLAAAEKSGPNRGRLLGWMMEAIPK